jgi:hypothetical protein
MFRRVRRAALALGGAAVIAGGMALVGSGTAFAYGAASQPVAQIEVSANCDNPHFLLCAAPPNGVGLGGIWFWTELDANGTGDMTGAVCNHTPGTPAGAGSIAGPDTWVATSLENAPSGAIFFGTFDPNDSYYAVTITIGETWLIPATDGHYAAHLTNGVQLELTTAP